MYYERMDKCINCNDCIDDTSDVSCNIACSDTKRTVMNHIRFLLLKLMLNHALFYNHIKIYLIWILLFMQEQYLRIYIVLIAQLSILRRKNMTKNEHLNAIRKLQFFAVDLNLYLDNFQIAKMQLMIIN